MIEATRLKIDDLVSGIVPAQPRKELAATV
jgi:hypothetical protein